MKTKEVLFNNKFINKTFKFNIYDLTVSNIKFNFKKFLQIFFGLRRFRSKIFLIGFSDSQYCNFSKLFKFFKINYFKGDVWIPGLFSNHKFIYKFIRIKRLNIVLKKKDVNHIKDFYKIFRSSSLPDLIIFYERKPYTKYILKECLKLKIPVIILFDINYQYDSNLIKVFHSNIKKEIFNKYLFSILKILLKKERIVEKKIRARRKQYFKYKKTNRYHYRNNNHRHKGYKTRKEYYHKK